MEYLIDTHILLWSIYDTDKLSNETKEILLNKENRIYYSTASLWEIEIKHNKKPKDFPFTAKEVFDACLDCDFENMPIFNKHIFKLEEIKKKDNLDHNDPFDLILLAQAKRHDIKLLTHDNKFKFYDEDCIKII